MIVIILTIHIIQSYNPYVLSFLLAQYFQSYGGAFMLVAQSRAPRLVVLTREGFVGDATTIARGIKYIRFLPPVRASLVGI